MVHTKIHVISPGCPAASCAWPNIPFIHLTTGGLGGGVDYGMLKTDVELCFCEYVMSRSILLF